VAPEPLQERYGLVAQTLRRLAKHQHRLASVALFIPAPLPSSSDSEEESRRAEEESRRAEEESRRAQRLASRLRELGVDPDTVD
jgi:hypothetical protein